MPARDRPYAYRVQHIGHRYGETCGTFVIRIPLTTPIEEDHRRYQALDDVIERSIEHERSEHRGMCDGLQENRDSHPDNCDLCHPQIVASTRYSAPAHELFTAETLREHRRDLVQGKVIALYP